jgi:hypothetical protein
MTTSERYQKARYIQDMLAQESTYGFGLNMQLILAELSDEDLAVIERVAQRCQTSRQASFYQSNSRLVHSGID